MSKLSIEERIAVALNSADATAADLDRLYAETDAAVAAADAAAVKAKDDALDPSISPDPRAARQAMEDAQFTAGRLRTLLPRLHRKQQTLAQAEYVASWMVDLKRVEAMRDEAAEAFAREYPAAVAQLVQLMHRIAAVDEEVGHVNRRRPSGPDYPHLHTVEREVRGHLLQPDVPIARELRLPHLHRNGGPVYAWPLPQPNLASLYLAGMPPDRFVASEARKGTYLDDNYRRALEDNQKQIADAEARQREREERDAAEARKAQEADRAAYYAEHGWPT